MENNCNSDCIVLCKYLLIPYINAYAHISLTVFMLNTMKNIKKLACIYYKDTGWLCKPHHIEIQIHHTFLWTYFSMSSELPEHVKCVSQKLLISYEKAELSTNVCWNTNLFSSWYLQYWGLHLGSLQPMHPWHQTGRQTWASSQQEWFHLVYCLPDTTHIQQTVTIIVNCIS